MRMTIVAWLAFSSAAVIASAADWPMVRGDAARSGYTAEALPSKLSLAWSYRPRHEPSPAWPRDDRMLFDRASDVVVADGRLFFGSSAEDQIVALDAQSGKTLWTYTTDSPVRFAPAVWQDRLFAVSDDGHLYCLSVRDGALIKSYRGGPTDEMILGNGRMVSRWPARGGPVIYDNIVYFATGIWQSEGVTVQAIDAASGDVVWTNDKVGSIYMPQPHGGAMANSGISAQGYLVATKDKLLVPTGRAVPAALDRHSGEFLYYHLQANGRVGGADTMVAGETFYNGGQAFKIATGELEAKLAPAVFAATDGGIVQSGSQTLKLLKVVDKTVPDRKGKPVQTRLHEAVWSSSDFAGGISAIVAGSTIVLGGPEKVTAIDSKSQKAVWAAEVDGKPYGLAAAGGRLYVSTDRGTIYCFDGEQHERSLTVGPGAKTAEPRIDGRYQQAADEIVRRTGVKEGFCLDLAGGEGDLALALAQRTNLQIYVLCSSAEEVAAARQKILAAGLYGARITVHQGSAAKNRYGKYFADLIVSSDSLRAGPLTLAAGEYPAVLRPFGGKICTGKLGAMDLIERGALAKTGSWTHQYSDLGNTSCSADEQVEGELHALWFRDVDLEMPQRHGRGPAPLFYQGRMFVEGIDALRAVDAYNGRNLWEFSLPGILKSYTADHLSGTSVTGSNVCVAGDSVYIHDKQRCYRIDAATGRKLGEFAAPPGADGKPGLWGYIACDGKRLYGSLANPEHRVRFGWVRADMSDQYGESSTLFALEPASGKLLWRYDAEDSIRHNTIAIGNGRVFLIDRPLAAEDKWEPDPKDTSRKLPPVTKVNQAPGRVIALTAETGKPAWKSEQEAFGTMLAYSAAHDTLLMSYQATRFKLPSEVGGRLAAYRGSTGKLLWDKKASYITRPLINDQTIYAQGGAWDLQTGEERPFELKRSYGCGQMAGSKNMLLFRSATLGYLDLSRGSGVENFGGIRPGCWINALPVGGLVLLPDASAGCSCSYQNRSWMALSGDDPAK
jgi:outer membrane protein assembly factor BamB